MKVIAINGSYRKGRTIDTLIDKAIEGIKQVCPSAEVEKIHLIDRNIKLLQSLGVKFVQRNITSSKEWNELRKSYDFLIIAIGKEQPNDFYPGQTNSRVKSVQ